jgi:RHS repeat-associated protein
VYFDDFKITHTKSNLIQGNEYYPFGMQTANSWTRESVTGNNYLANGGTELNATTQLYDLHYRNYDAALGRMFQLDPMASKYGSLTPYNYSLNNPTNLNDPLGDDVEPQPMYPREYLCAMCWREGDSKALYMMVSGGGGFEGQWSYRQSGINSANSFWHNGVIDWKRELKADAEAVKSGEMSYADYGSKYGATIYEKGAGIEWSAEIFNPWMGTEISRTADNTITYSGSWMPMNFGVMAKLMVKGYQLNVRNVGRGNGFHPMGPAQGGVSVAGFADGANYNFTSYSSLFGLQSFLADNGSFWRGKNGQYYSKNLLYKDYWGTSGKYARGVSAYRGSANLAQAASQKFSAAGKLFGGASVVATVWAGFSDGSFSFGDGAKTAIGLLTVFTPYGWAYGIFDIAVQVATGTSITDRVGSYVDKHW